MSVDGFHIKRKSSECSKGFLKLDTIRKTVVLAFLCLIILCAFVSITYQILVRLCGRALKKFKGEVFRFFYEWWRNRLSAKSEGSEACDNLFLPWLDEILVRGWQLDALPSWLQWCGSLLHLFPCWLFWQQFFNIANFKNQDLYFIIGEIKIVIIFSDHVWKFRFAKV